MIIVRLTGGLGNQLFQYAFARSLSLLHNKELFLDISIFSHDNINQHAIFGLNAFNIKGNIGNYPYRNNSAVGLNTNSSSQIYKVVEGDPANFPYDIFDYKMINSDSKFEFPVYFQGYFQKQNKDNSSIYITENFFKINNQLIHEDLKYNSDISEIYHDVMKDMQIYDSIALHVRHGDYENFPNFGFCSKEYYEKSIELLASKVENPKFFVFTQDYDWVTENLKIDYPHELISFEENINLVSRGYAEQLKLMSLCDHFIIANSTYSWWASFLSENEKKIIIAPKPWFQDRSFVEVDTIDNIKPLNVENTYNKPFYLSKNCLFKFNNNNFHLENMSIIKNKEVYEFFDLNSSSKLFINNIAKNNDESKVIINLSFESDNFNCMKIFFKTKNEDFCEKNSRMLYYYKNDSVNQFIILPSEAILDNLLIMPSILEDYDVSSIILRNLEIREV